MKTQKLGVYSKADFLLAYGVTMPTFEKWIEEIQAQIGWKKGHKQKFPPRLVQIVFDYLGEPE